MFGDLIKKKCNKCGEMKSKSEFHPRIGYKDNLRSCCKKCHRIESDRWIANNPEKHRANSLAWKHRNKDRLESYRLFREFGITLKVYNEIFSNQGEKCAICGTEEQGKRKFHVDHNHNTGTVRAILCQNCNFLIGNCKEDVDILQSAISYLCAHMEEEKIA
jgi:hypothetical protein